MQKFIFIGLLAWGNLLFSQDNRSLFLELGGSGGIASLNYEKVFHDGPTIDFSYRLGFSFFPVDPNNGTSFIFPVLVNALYGQGTHKAEAGIGQGFTLTTKGKAYIAVTPALGYRFQPEQGRLFFRATYTPIVTYLLDFQWQHWAGVSIGYRFK